MKKLMTVLLLLGCALEAAAQPKRIIRRGPGGPGGAEVTKDWPKITAAAAGDAAIAPAADAYLKALAARDLFSGTVLLARGGEPLFVRSYGLADREARVPNADGTRYNIGSITKTFTQVALLQLRDAGKLDLAKTLRTYLPDYPSKIADEVTLQQLVDHRSGMGDIFGPAFDAKKDGLKTLPDYLALFADAPLEFAPGTDDRYSNAGYIVLGLVIEKVSGQSYYDYVREHVLVPAGMTDSGFPLKGDAGAGRATGYTTRTPQPGPPGPKRRNLDVLPARGSSAGGSDSTAADLLRFVRALPKLVSPASWRALMRIPPQAPASAPLGTAWGGGLPGGNALVQLEGPWEVIVLANTDPPAAEEIGRNLGVLLGFPRED
ncbi:MAG: serine hydrolase domain-containing protein [Vicinamibacteria bacterium]